MDPNWQAAVSAALRGQHGGDQRLVHLLHAAQLAKRVSELDDALDHLASHARDSEMGLNALVLATYRLRLARPAIRQVLISDEDTADAEQQTLLAVTTGIGSFRREARYRSWLYTVARREALRVLAARERTPVSGDLDGADLAGFVESMSSMLITRTEVAKAIDQLLEPFRTPVIMRDVDKLSYADIAAQLGRDLGTLKGQISRGRARVQQQLAKTLAERLESSVPT